VLLWSVVAQKASSPSVQQAQLWELEQPEPVLVLP
jgi:hypothetical protein